MRRRRGTTRLPWTASSREARGRNLPPSVGVQFVPVLTSSARRSGMLRLTSAGIASRQAVRDRADSPPRCLCWRSVSVRRESSGRAWLPSSPSSPPKRCPGSGLQRSRRLLASKPLRPPRRSRGPRRLRIRPAVANLPPPPRQPCWRIKCRRRGRLYPYKGTRGARIVSARRGELMGSFRGAQVRACATSGDAFRIGPGRSFRHSHRILRAPPDGGARLLGGLMANRPRRGCSAKQER